MVHNWPSAEYCAQISKLDFAKYASAKKHGNNDIVSFVVKNSSLIKGIQV